jgi:RNA polymerase sigma-70 factor, ECF subfamily
MAASQSPKAASLSVPNPVPLELIDDESRLIDAALAGEPDAFGLIVQQHQDRLYSSLLRLTDSPEDAQDIAQEAFVQAFLKLSTFQRNAAFFTWLYRIAFNLAVSSRRKKRPKTSLEAVREAGGLEPTATCHAPDGRTLTAERVTLVQNCLAELADEHRSVMVLREIEGFDYEQIAEVLTIPVGTVRSRLFRARAALKEKLQLSLGEQWLEFVNETD